MKKQIVFLTLFSLACHLSFSQIDLKGLQKEANKALGNSGTGLGAGLSNDEIVSGLREALTVGSNNAGSLASKLDGYYKNPKIKIPFPKEAQEMESTLRGMGMSQPVDKFVMTLNRAAEDAAKSASPIFVAAVKGMNISDGLSILKGGDNAATEFLKKSTNTELLAKFKPVIAASLKKVEITKYWNPLASKYNALPMVRKVNPNLEDYVTKKAIEGLFYLVAQEELKIRKDPIARVSDILKKVFGK